MSTRGRVQKFIRQPVRAVRWTLPLFAMLACFSPMALGAESTAADSPKRLTFQMAAQLLPTSRVEVSNGALVKREDWPTLVMAKLPDVDKPATCTGTLVGPNAVLTAAHCVDVGTEKPRPAQLVVFGQVLELTCEIHPHYLHASYRKGATRNSHDYALCLLGSGKESSAYVQSLRFEVVEADTPLKAADPVLFTGYGCDRLRVSEYGVLDWNSSTGALTVGNGRVDSPAGTWNDEIGYLTLRSRLGKDAALCPGDSGGPLFSGITVDAPTGARRIRGVNSRVCSQVRSEYSTACALHVQNGTWDVISSISATASAVFKAWAQSWAGRNADAVVCGINRPAGVMPCKS